MTQASSPSSDTSNVSPSPDAALHSLPSDSMPVGDTPKKRVKLPKEATDHLKDWLHRHANHPYPTEEEKRQMCATTGLTMSQISNWMINARRRILAPLQRSKGSPPPHAVESDHVPLLPPNGGDATLLLQGLSQSDFSILDDLDLFFSTPAALELPSGLVSADPQPYRPSPQLLHTAHSTPQANPRYPATRQRVFPGFTFIQSTPEAQAAYAIAAMQAEREQRAEDFTPMAFPYW